MVDILTWAVFWKTTSHPDKWTQCGEWRPTIDEAIADYNFYRGYANCTGIRLMKRREHIETCMQEN